ncbi:MAG: radical SAM protein [Candidatus Omnitrophica bacterium]|nr:radical SAM protein [Candidatus Omnitrophota bacterium]
MIEKENIEDFAKTLREKTKGLKPISAQLEMTYRCDLDCVHCYCKNYMDGDEISIEQWKNILDQLYSAGCLYLTFTGGEPFLKKGFLEAYDHAKKKGFIITVFSNGMSLTDADIEYLAKCPPFSIEITVHAMDKDVFDSISGQKGSFELVMKNIKKLVDAKVQVIIKTVILKENKNEIFKVKKFAEELLGPKKFKTDSFIIPTLTGDTTPCEHRLSPKEIQNIEESDVDMIMQREEQFQKHTPMMRDIKYKYHCNSWFNQVFISPSGKLKFCHISKHYTYDLTKVPLEEAFYINFPSIWEEENHHYYKCMTCELREYCHYCPARAYLETGDEYSSVEYYCELAKLRKERHERSNRMRESE